VHLGLVNPKIVVEMKLVMNEKDDEDDNVKVRGAVGIKIEEKKIKIFNIFYSRIRWDKTFYRCAGRKKGVQGINALQ